MEFDPEKQPMVIPNVDRVPRFVQETPPPLFPQSIKKEKGRTTIWQVYGDLEAA